MLSLDDEAAIRLMNSWFEKPDTSRDEDWLRMKRAVLLDSLRLFCFDDCQLLRRMLSIVFAFCKNTGIDNTEKNTCKLKLLSTICSF